MIWLRRLLPLVIIGLGWGGYTLWERWHTEKQTREEIKLAQVTAQVWIATAKYRNDPARFMQYRDSLLEASGVPRDKVLAFLKNREARPEELLPFAQKVQRQVDSLHRIEDSILKAEAKQDQDSMKARDSISLK